METEEPHVPAGKKEYGKRAAAKKKSSTVTVLDSSDSENENVVADDDDDFELGQQSAPETEKKKRGRKPAAQNAARKPPAATRKRGVAANKQSQILGQKFITDMLKPAAENSGISPEKKVRKMRESPFNKKSGSLLAKVVNKDETESEELSGSASTSPGADEAVEIAPAARARPQRANRRQTTYVVSDSDNETDDDDEATEDSDFDEED